ncbi:MAG: TIGR04076 family protein [Desulfarculaceae bacterium]|nr:TIGR04076 family protein [Desulfarculaceae bacterium]
MSDKPKLHRVKVKVVEVKNHCDAGHRVGDEVVFENNRVEGKLCFDSMCSMLATVHTLCYGGVFPWFKDPDAPVPLACPDGGKVVFELSRID